MWRVANGLDNADLDEQTEHILRANFTGNNE